MKGLMMARGPARLGKSLLPGLLRCSHCGRKLYVEYSGKGRIPRYACRAASQAHGEPMCISFGGLRVDQVVEEKVLGIIQPAMIEASLQAADQQTIQQDQKREALALALEQARYEAERAFRQYNVIEPENRLVALELEKRWNETLERVKTLEKEIAEISSLSEGISQDERNQLLALSEDLPRVWLDERSDMSIKKRIVRTLIEEIIADARTIPSQIELTIHWVGGVHSQVKIERNYRGRHRFSTDKETVDLVRDLAAVMSDGDIARILNRLGPRTTHGNSWTKNRVIALRHSYDINVYNPENLKGLLNMQQAAKHLGISPMSVLRLIQKGIIAARQVLPGAPRLIKEDQLNTEKVRRVVECVKNRIKVPLPDDLNQQLLFSSTHK